MCADLASQQASPGNWPSDMAHQAFTADAVHDGSMRDGMVPSKPPGDASRSAGLPHQAGGGPQAGVPRGVQSQPPLCRVSHLKLDRTRSSRREGRGRGTAWVMGVLLLLLPRQSKGTWLQTAWVLRADKALRPPVEARLHQQVCSFMLDHVSPA